MKTNTTLKRQSQNSQDIWYRNPMVWLAIGLPAFVVLASIVTIVIAFNNAPMLIEESASTEVSAMTATESLV